MARAIRCPGASVPASTTASPNPGGDAVAPLAFSFTAKRNYSPCRRGGAQCRRWATFSARVEIPPILGPERGLEMLTAVQWRPKLGLTEFRSDHVFLREVAVKRMDEGLYRNGIHGCGLLKQTALKNSFFIPMVPRSSQRRGRAEMPVLDGVLSCLASPFSAHRRLLGAASAPCMLEGQFSTSAPSAPAADLTAAAAVGLLLEERDSGAKLRRVSWIADSTYALDVTRTQGQRAGSTPTSRVVRGQRYDGCRVLRPSIQESRATSTRTCWRNWAVKA